MESVMRLALVVAALVVSSPAFAQETAKSPTFSKAECVVWARELAFADSVKAHDAKAFADFVNTGAVFGVGSGSPVRGRPAVVKDWAGIIDGSALVLSWYPTAVAIGGEGDIAYSTGRALLESPAGKTPKRVSVSTFVSTWHRDSDGKWRVLLDGGATPHPASDADVAAFHAERKTCPQG
jgi:ketosteroid isomerase-like protein